MTHPIDEGVKAETSELIADITEMAARVGLCFGADPFKVQAYMAAQSARSTLKDKQK